MKLLTPFVPAPVRQPETEEQVADKKALFAELLLKEPDAAFKVALLIYPDDTGQALRVANLWPNDPDVKRIQKSMLESEGEMSFLPTEAEDLRDLLTKANKLFELGDSEGAARFHKMYLEVRGRIQRPAVAVNQTNNTIVNRVMVVKDHGTDDQWEAKAVAQQERLKREAAIDIEATP